MNLIEQLQRVDALLHRISVSGENVGYLWQARQGLKQIADIISAESAQRAQQEEG